MRQTLHIRMQFTRRGDTRLTLHVTGKIEVNDERQQRECAGVGDTDTRTCSHVLSDTRHTCQTVFVPARPTAVTTYDVLCRIECMSGADARCHRFVCAFWALKVQVVRLSWPAPCASSCQHQILLVTDS